MEQQWLFTRRTRVVFKQQLLVSPGDVQVVAFRTDPTSAGRVCEGNINKNDTDSNSLSQKEKDCQMENNLYSTIADR